MRWIGGGLMFLMLLPAASACQTAWPFIDIELDHERCAFVDLAPSPEGCDPVPDTETRYEGLVRLTYVLDVACYVEGPYPISDTVIEFNGTQSNPDWLVMRVEPERIVIPGHEFWHPANMDTDGQDVWWSSEHPMSLTVERARLPVMEERERVEDSNGTVRLYVKAHVLGQEEGATGWMNSFGVEELRFDGRAHLPPVVTPLGVEDKATPIGVGFVVAPLAAALLRRL